MTNLPKFTDLAKMVLIFEKEHSVLVTDNKTCKINADMSFEVLAKKGKYKKWLEFEERETVKSSQNNSRTYTMPETWLQIRGSWNMYTLWQFVERFVVKIWQSKRRARRVSRWSIILDQVISVGREINDLGYDRRIHITSNVGCKSLRVEGWCACYLRKWQNIFKILQDHKNVNWH